MLTLRYQIRMLDQTIQIFTNLKVWVIYQF
jgi:hypothetical protein